MKSPRGCFYIFYTVSIMKSVGVRIKPEREYFLLYRTQNSVCFERSFGLKRCGENFSSVSEKGRAHSPVPVDQPGHRSSWPHIPGCGCSLPSQLLPWYHGIRNSGRNIYSLSLCWYAHACYRTSDSILTLVIGSSYAPLKTLACRGSLETSCAQKLIPPGRRGIRWTHRHPAFQFPGPRIQH